MCAVAVNGVTWVTLTIVCGAVAAACLSVCVCALLARRDICDIENARASSCSYVRSAGLLVYEHALSAKKIFHRMQHTQWKKHLAKNNLYRKSDYWRHKAKKYVENMFLSDIWWESFDCITRKLFSCGEKKNSGVIHYATVFIIYFLRLQWLFNKLTNNLF